MRKYLEEFMLECSYPQDSILSLLADYDKLIAACANEMYELVYEYEKHYDVDYDAAIRKMKVLSETSVIHEYSGELLLFLCYTRALRRYYREAGISDEIYLNTVSDLKYKLDECKCVYGVHGTFVAFWFAGFFKLERFGLGRLQFEIVPLGTEYEKNGVCLSEDTRVINVHIPRTGARLDRESTIEAYRLAADFFGSHIGDTVAFVCNSWLLFPRHEQMLSEGANLRLFIKDYDLIASGEYSSYAEVWRLFDTMYDGDADHLPHDTSLRRAYVDLIKRNECTGWGRGVFIYNHKYVKT
jgi:hypothetical protein